MSSPWAMEKGDGKTKPRARTSRRPTPGALLLGALAVLVVAYALWRSHDSSSEGDGGSASADDVTPARRLRVHVLGERPHDTEAFTQGLVLDGTRMYESIGRYGQSALREIDPTTGEERRRVDLPREIFAEGLALAHGKLTQISWREGKAIVWDAHTFEKVAEHRYSGEGWGLCFDGRRLVMSDGSAFLTFRDPETFRSTGEIQVTVDGEPQDHLNELECVGNRVYANVWTTDEILEIDPRTGRALAVIDASGLLTAEESADVDVLNGIAYDPRTRHFLITGKLWPKLFEVEFVE
jgi:glutaminyl-peptide cyclotransferase